MKNKSITIDGVKIDLTPKQLFKIAQEKKKQKEVPISITERIKTFKDIIRLSGKPASYFKDKSLSKDELGYRKVKTIASVYNEGWKADYGDSNQKKWYPFFQYDKPNSSFGFSDTYYDGWATHADGGSPLCVFKNEKLAKDAGIKFIKEYNEFLIG